MEWFVVIGPEVSSFSGECEWVEIVWVWEDRLGLPVFVCADETIEFAGDVSTAVLVDVSSPFDESRDVGWTGAGRVAIRWFHMVSPLAICPSIFRKSAITLDVCFLEQHRVDEIVERVWEVVKDVAVLCKWVCRLVECLCIRFSCSVG